jgi:lipopolysaccharide assembly protein A
MRILGQLTKLFVFLLLLSFTLKNSDSVTLYYFFGMQWTAPLSVLLLIAFALGTAAGLLALLGRLFRAGREISHLKKSIRQAEKTASASPPAEG